uniref:Uncharacterized protein n=1 Tax=Arundo donax TaxID=35708 RepID=A0A0A9GEC5_ARUDO
MHYAAPIKKNRMKKFYNLCRFYQKDTHI